LLSSINVQAADLTGSVSFGNGLYTYSYELSASDTPVTEVLVLVNSTAARYSLAPLSSTTPAGWYQATFGGRSLDGVSDSYVTWWGWGNQAAGTAAVTGFSFTTTAAPAANPVAVTYALFSPAYTGGPPQHRDFFLGSVIAPDFLLPDEPPPSTVPEADTYAMLLAGLGLIGAIGRRRAKRNRSHGSIATTYAGQTSHAHCG